MVASRLLFDQEALTVLLPVETTTLLAEAGHYPIFDEIENLLISSGLSEMYSAQDVVRIFNYLIERAGNMEEYTGISFALYNGGVSFRPTIEDVYSSNNLQSVFVEIMGKIAAAVSLDEQLHLQISVFSPLAEKSHTANVRGELSAVDPDVELFSSGNITVTIPLSNDLRSLLLSLNDYQIWKTADDGACLAFGIMVGVLRFGVDNGLCDEVGEIPKFSVGSEFLQSLIINQGIGEGRFCHVVYQQTVSVIWRRLGERMVDRTRPDDAIAMRHHLTASHEALRLMYWINGGAIELANIGPKKELKIARGDGHPVELRSRRIV